MGPRPEMVGRVVLAAVLASVVMCLPGIDDTLPEDAFNGAGEFHAPNFEKDDAQQVRAARAVAHLPGVAALQNAAEHSAAITAVENAEDAGVTGGFDAIWKDAATKDSQQGLLLYAIEGGHSVE